MTPDYKVDRTGWPPGEWDAEPDRLEWRARGFPCLIRRAPIIGVLCGYVAIPPGHPWHGQAAPLPGIDYTDVCRGGVCHVPQPGEPDDVWWVGFSCLGDGDLIPGELALFSRVGHPELARKGTYRNIAYVKDVVESLATLALAAAAHG